MNILDYYKKNESTEFFKKFQSTADKNYGKTFQYYSTNCRRILSFITGFDDFVKYLKKGSLSKEKIKQWTVRMERSKLFRKEQGKYTLTAKGMAFKKFVDNKTFTEDEQWILVYYFLLNSYFYFQGNYIIKKSNSIYSEILKEIKYKSHVDTIFYDLFKNSIDIIKDSKEKKYSKDKQFKKLIEYDAFWILTFYKDKDFINKYYNSSMKEKEDLKKYILNEKRKNPNDLLVYKYKSDGQYKETSFIDDVKVLYITNKLLEKTDNTGPLKFAENIISIYNNISSSKVLGKKILNFIKTNFDVFEVIFNEVIPVSEIIDNTTIKNKKYYEYNVRNVTMELREKVKENAKNKCVLEYLNGPCPTFNTKEKEPYLEIHHLIPFAVSNSFDKSLDIEQNLVPLCPRCHRLLHFAEDDARRESLQKLFKKYKKQLKDNGIDVKPQEFLKMYGVEE